MCFFAFFFFVFGKRLIINNVVFRDGEKCN